MARLDPDGRRDPRRQAGGQDVARRGRGGAPRASACAGSATPARSTRSPPACCWCWSAGPRARSASSWRCPRPTRPGALRRGLDHRRPRGRDRRDRRRPRPGRSRCPTGRDPPAPAGLLRGQGRRASGPTGARAAARRSSARARGRRPPLRAALARRRPRGFEIECSAGTYVRSLIADLGDAYCEELRRTRDRAVRRRRRRPRPGRAAGRGADVPARGAAGRRRGRGGPGTGKPSTTLKGV